MEEKKTKKTTPRKKKTVKKYNFDDYKYFIDEENTIYRGVDGCLQSLGYVGSKLCWNAVKGETKPLKYIEPYELSSVCNKIHLNINRLFFIDYE